MKNMMKMMQAAQQMQTKIQQVSEEIKAMEFEGTAGAGAVRVKVSGAGEILEINTTYEVKDASEKEMLLDLIVVACNNAKAIASEASNKKMEEVKNSLGLPQGLELPNIF